MIISMIVWDSHPLKHSDCVNVKTTDANVETKHKCNQVSTFSLSISLTILQLIILTHIASLHTGEDLKTLADMNVNQDRVGRHLNIQA
jgi:hypothetical protein